MHLLVVEDDPRLSRVLKRLLEEDRHVVEVANDGETGLEIAEDAPGLEAVILDIGLPDMSGLEVARRLRQKGSELAILMLTARDTVGDRVSGLDSGADDYLVKPFAYEELAARLRALARRSSGGSRRALPKLTVGPITLAETDALAADGRLIRRVRWRLVAFSGGTTLLVLVVLGIALYLTAAATLQARGEQQLEQRADAMLARGGPDPDRPDFGAVFGGVSSGTYVLISD